MNSMALAHFPFLCSEPRASARAVFRHSMYRGVRCARRDKTENALKRPTHRIVVIVFGSLMFVLTLAVCAKYIPAIGLSLFGPPRVTMGEAFANSPGKAQVDHHRLDRLLRAHVDVWLP